jgi:hypothetical protein
MIGLKFDERMSGTWHALAEPAVERPIEFTVRATVGRLRELVGNTVAELRGRISVEGITGSTDARGTLGLGALVRERRLPYSLTFTGDDGKRYRLDGAKEVELADLPRTMTVLPAYLFDDGGNEIGRAVLRFDLQGDLFKFLRSWKPLLGRAARAGT